MATQSSILDWDIPRTEEPGRLLWGRKRSNYTIAAAASVAPYCKAALLSRLTRSRRSGPHSPVQACLGH